MSNIITTTLATFKSDLLKRNMLPAAYATESGWRKLCSDCSSCREAQAMLSAGAVSQATLKSMSIRAEVNEKASDASAGWTEFVRFRQLWRAVMAMEEACFEAPKPVAKKAPKAKKAPTPTTPAPTATP
jgi:hypothetical protein